MPALPSCFAQRELTSARGNRPRPASFVYFSLPVEHFDFLRVFGDIATERKTPNPALSGQRCTLAVPHRLRQNASLQDVIPAPLPSLCPNTGAHLVVLPSLPLTRRLIALSFKVDIANSLNATVRWVRQPWSAISPATTRPLVRRFGLISRESVNKHVLVLSMLQAARSCCNLAISVRHCTRPAKLARRSLTMQLCSETIGARRCTNTSPRLCWFPWSRERMCFIPPRTRAQFAAMQSQKVRP
mmetsp:Transcript_59932/g.160482  ORF Transcript_59932/g.160482 Transcript_59932/m.160482 type:complete len:243 (+) Transcript_59932:2393-3121(+)